MIRRFALQSTATASVEFALLVPMLVILLFGGSEAGHFVWTQHKLVEAVRDGARYASRLPVQDVCDGASSIIAGTAAEDNVKLVTRTGQLASINAKPVVPGFTAAQVDVEINCQDFVDTGIYTDLGGAGPVVTVRASGVGYPMLFGGLGFVGSGFTLSASSNAAVIGI
jgi:Flp pilus assembly protein TadG